MAGRSSSLNWSSLYDQWATIHEGFGHLVVHVICRIGSLCEHFPVAHVKGRFSRFVKVKEYYFRVLGYHSFT